MTLPGSSVLDARGQVCSLQVKDQLDLSLLLQPQEVEQCFEVVVRFLDLADHCNKLKREKVEIKLEFIATQQPYLAQLDSPVWVLWHLLPSLLLHVHLALLHDVEDRLEGLLPVVNANRLGEK